MALRGSIQHQGVVRCVFILRVIENEDDYDTLTSAELDRLW